MTSDREMDHTTEMLRFLVAAAKITGKNGGNGPVIILGSVFLQDLHRMISLIKTHCQGSDHTATKGLWAGNVQDRRKPGNKAEEPICPRVCTRDPCLKSSKQPCLRPIGLCPTSSHPKRLHVCTSGTSAVLLFPARSQATARPTMGSSCRSCYFTGRKWLLVTSLTSPQHNPHLPRGYRCIFLTWYGIEGSAVIVISQERHCFCL